MQTESPGRPEDIKAVPVRRPGRWLVAFIVLVILASVVRAIVTNPRFHWGEVWHYLSDPRILHGVVATMYLTVLAMVVGVVLGVILAIMRLSPNPVLSSASWLYIYLFRGRRCWCRSSSGTTSPRCFRTSTSVCRLGRR